MVLSNIEKGVLELKDAEKSGDSKRALKAAKSLVGEIYRLIDGVQE